jgi:DNA primase
MVKVDPRGNAIFPHFDDMGLSGYEIRGQDFKGFSKHGEKTLWHSANLDEAREVIFVEGAINALSHAQLYPNAEAAYVSIGGQMSETQRQLVARVMRDAASQGAVIVLATDGDNAGEAHAQALKALAPAGAHIERDRPVPGLDWNDQAKQQLEQHQQAQHRR